MVTNLWQVSEKTGIPCLYFVSWHSITVGRITKPIPYAMVTDLWHVLAKIEHPVFIILAGI